MIYGIFFNLFTEVLSIITAVVTILTAIEEFMHRRSAQSSSGGVNGW